MIFTTAYVILQFVNNLLNFAFRNYGKSMFICASKSNPSLLLSVSSAEFKLLSNLETRGSQVILSTGLEYLALELYGSQKIFLLSRYEGGRDKGLTPSQHPVNGYEL